MVVLDCYRELFSGFESDPMCYVTPFIKVNKIKRYQNYEISIEIDLFQSSVALPLNLSTSFTPRQPLMQSNSCSSSNSQQQSSSSSKALLSSHGNNSIDPNRANNHTPSVVVTSAMNPNHPTKILTGTCGGSSEGSGWKFNSPGGGAADAYDNLPSTSPNSSYRTCSETQTSSMAMVNSHVQVRTSC